MRDLPLISVALCTYNGERFLREQLDSVLAQDYPSLEVVVVDDASTDGTRALLDAYAARDPRIRVTTNPTNLGFRRNFEVALGRCRGELIAPCDQDDVWLPGKLRLLQAALGAADAVYCDSELVDDLGRPLGIRMSDRFCMRTIVDPVVLLFGNCISGHALLLRRSLLDRALPVPAGVYHDWWLGLTAAASTPVPYVPEPLVRYRQHASNVTDVLHRRDAREPAWKLRALEETECRLRAAAGLAAREAPFFADVLRLWLGWKSQWVCPRFTLFLLRHRDRLFALRPTHRGRYVRDAIKHFWGLPPRRLLTPAAYRPASGA